MREFEAQVTVKKPSGHIISRFTANIQGPTIEAAIKQAQDMGRMFLLTPAVIEVTVNRKHHN
jgi:hypothetical protein